MNWDRIEGNWKEVRGKAKSPVYIEVEDFDNGGAGVAYNDTTPENSGGAGRLNEGVDIVTVDGITAVSWIYNDEWTEYTVEVPAGTLAANGAEMPETVRWTFRTPPPYAEGMYERGLQGRGEGGMLTITEP